MKSHTKTKVDQLLERGQQLIDQAEAEGRARTDEEDIELEGIMAKVKRLNADAKAEEQIAAIGKAMGPGQDSGIQDGWTEVAQRIAGGTKTLEVPGKTLLRSGSVQQARGKDLTATDVADGAVATAPGLMGLGADRRHLYPLLPSLPVTGELSVADYRQTGSRTVTGDVERSLTGTTAKAELDVAVEYVQEPLRQVAVTISGVPNALLAGVPALRSFLQTEMQYQLDLAVDDHILTEVARIGVEVTGQVSRKAFAMKFSGALGSAVVADKVKIVIDVAAVKEA